MGDQLSMKKWFETGWDGVKGQEKGSSKYEGPELKSAVQKYIRRGEIEKAVRTADEMIRIGAAGSLLRRIPSIVGEDCGWRKLWAVQVCYDLKWGENPLTPDQRLRLLTVVAMLARGFKDKDAEHMNDVLVNRNPAPPQTLSEEDMQTTFALALDRKDELMAGRMIVRWSHQLKGKLHKAAFWPILLTEGQKRKELRNLAGILEAVKRRIGQGFFFVHDGDGLVLAMIQAVCREGGWDDEVPESLAEEIAAWAKDPKPVTLDWYCLDMHTVIGKIAAKSLCTKKGWDYRRLDEHWFCFESTKLNGHLPAKYWDGWEWNFRTKFDTSLEEARAEWETKYREDCRGMVEWLMGKRGKK